MTHPPHDLHPNDPHGFYGRALHARSEVLLQRVDDTVVLLDTRSGAYFQLNRVAGRIFELCDGRTAAEITAQLLREFDAPAERVRADVDATLERLLDARLVGTGDANAGA